MTNSTHDDIERTARRRAGAKMGWYIHAMVFIAVNVLLALLSLSAGRNWAIFPALGWGLGLAIHGIVVFFVTGGGGLQDKLVAQERDKLLQDRGGK